MLALLLRAVGLYGMLSATVARRTAEIGMRIALGAGRGQIARMIARETLVVVSAGAGLGLAGHAVTARLIQSQLFGVEPSDPAAAAATVASLLVIAAIAVWLPARRAMRIARATRSGTTSHEKSGRLFRAPARATATLRLAFSG